MSYAKVLSVGLVGVTGHLVEVEADLAAGLPAVVISGLPDTALHEARDRVRAAVVFPVKFFCSDSACATLAWSATILTCPARPTPGSPL